MDGKVVLPKVQTRLEVKNEVDSEIAELYLYGMIRPAYYWEEEDECISAKNVKKKLSELKGKDINIHINSPGGDAYESIAIRNLLKQHDGDIYIYIDSLAASGGSIISTAGKIVYMFECSMQMVHKAWTIALGNEDELRKEADRLAKLDTSLKAAYMSKFVGTEKELEKLVADETWLTAEECLAFGLCDEIIKGDDEEEDSDVENNIKETLFNKYKGNIEPRVVNKTTLFNAMKKKNIGGTE